MGRVISIGAQGFADLRERDNFLVDKTDFIRQWWTSDDQVTLICRPRRFGKTLNMSMLECFFSLAYAARDDLFAGLSVWNDEGLRAQQGVWPVVSLSFAGIKSTDAHQASFQIRYEIARAYRSAAQMVDVASLDESERDLFEGRALAVDEELAPLALQRLCELLYRHNGRRAIVLLDEYDTPMQEAWLTGCWDEVAASVRALFNSTFKTNPYLERAVLTGVTRVSRESIFSDLNNLEVVTTTSLKYADCFGFTQSEVFEAMDEMGRTDRTGVKEWYDGFSFGGRPDIYNPWSITKYLETGKLGPYWANTSSNALVSRLVRESDPDVKADMEELLNGGAVWKRMDEQVAFDELRRRPDALWALLLSAGYVKVASAEDVEAGGRTRLALTNREVREAFDDMVRGWFEEAPSRYNGFVRALLDGNVAAMNRYMNDIALATFSSFDAGSRASSAEPEKFYHGFVLGLLVELRGTYRVTSNRESGYGRCDVMLEPLRPGLDGIVLEFKAVDSFAGEKCLEDALASAKAQIEQKRYTSQLQACGVPAEQIRCYGLAFQGKKVLIG